MFGMVKSSLDNSMKNDIETIIGNNTVIKGEINGSGNLRVDGLVEGGVNVSGCVIVGENGRINGDVSADEMIISGSVEGNVTTNNCLSICSTGQLTGDVKAGSLKIEEGGSFQGRSEMNFKPADPAFAE